MSGYTPTTDEIPEFHRPEGGRLELSGGVGYVPDGRLVAAGPGPKLIVDGEVHDLPDWWDADVRPSRRMEQLMEAASEIREERGI